MLGRCMGIIAYVHIQPGYRMAAKRQINVGGVKIGGGADISVQTMTNTDTADVAATLRQIHLAADLGCDLIRVSCPTPASTKALKDIVRDSPIPVIADIHFNFKRALEAIEAGAACVRINPGNTPEHGIREIVAAAKARGVAIRLGINAGSLARDILEKYGEPTVDAIVECAVLNCQKLEALDFRNFKVSVKSSDVRQSIAAYRKLSRLVDYPLHLGITEAGTLFPGTIKSAIGIGSLLADGIGDTLRVSLSGDVTEEVRVGRQILKSLNLLKNAVDIVSCPTCARTLIDVVGISKALEEYCENVHKKLKISVLGCVVNGIGEARGADIGVFGFQKGVAKLFVHGKEERSMPEEEVLPAVKDLIQRMEG